MRKILYVIVVCIVVACGRTDVSKDIAIPKIKLSKNIYDSIQVFVDANTNSRSEIYLLAFLGRRFDSVDYILTEIHPKAITEKYKNSLYFYNKDSSLLIVDDYYASLYEHSYSENYLCNNTKISFSLAPNSVIFNPMVWRLTVVNNQVFMDRSYGVQEAEKKIKIPKQPFHP